jgi:hypothetical protein
MRSQAFRALLAFIFVVPVYADSWVSQGRAPDSTSKRLAEIRESERRRQPLEVLLQVQEGYSKRGPMPVTVMITNLFQNPLVVNSRLLVNHPRMPGEMFFRILGPDGHPLQIRRIITPLALRGDDFVVLSQGRTIERTIDLADLYDLHQKGVYRVDVCYHNEVDLPIGHMRAWTGIIASDPVDIRVN